MNHPMRIAGFKKHLLIHKWIYEIMSKYKMQPPAYSLLHIAIGIWAIKIENLLFCLIDATLSYRLPKHFAFPMKKMQLNDINSPQTSRLQYKKMHLNHHLMDFLYLKQNPPACQTDAGVL
jgi:hypothetical protein